MLCHVSAAAANRPPADARRQSHARCAPGRGDQRRLLDAAVRTLPRRHWPRIQRQWHARQRRRRGIAPILRHVDRSEDRHLAAGHDAALGALSRERQHRGRRSAAALDPTARSLVVDAVSPNARRLDRSPRSGRGWTRSRSASSLAGNRSRPTTKRDADIKRCGLCWSLATRAFRTCDGGRSRR